MDVIDNVLADVPYDTSKARFLERRPTRCRTRRRCMSCSRWSRYALGGRKPSQLLASLTARRPWNRRPCSSIDVPAAAALHLEDHCWGSRNPATSGAWRPERTGCGLPQRKDIEIEHRARKAARLASWEKMTQPG
jgi:hypothetical protein